MSLRLRLFLAVAFVIVAHTGARIVLLAQDARNSARLAQQVQGEWVGKSLAKTLTNALIERGRSAFQREQWDEAVQIFRRVLTAKGPGIDPLGDLAMALFARGDLEEALQRFSESLAISPRQLGVWQYKGMALARLGRADEALACFARA